MPVLGVPLELVHEMESAKTVVWEALEGGSYKLTLSDY